MLAVIELWWNQFIVKVWDIIEVKKQKEEENEIIIVEPLLISDEKWISTKIGNPELKWLKIELKVLKQFKWEKIRVFKMKSKKRYSRNKWFRPSLTRLEMMTMQNNSRGFAKVFFYCK